MIFSMSWKDSLSLYAKQAKTVKWEFKKSKHRLGV